MAVRISLKWGQVLVKELRLTAMQTSLLCLRSGIDWEMDQDRRYL